MSDARIGTTYNVQPVPPDPDSTDWLDLGPLRVGVEYRKVDPEALEAAYGDDADDLAEIVTNSPEGGFSDEGVSIHVVDPVDGHEYVRFDVFVDEPHYHYVDRAAGTNTLVHFDPHAFGPMMPWLLDGFPDRLPPMLRYAGAHPLADRLDAEALVAARDAIAAKLREIGELP